MTFAEAQRAIYIGFECVKRAPALLGVLRGADGEDPAQIITDDRLAPASVANRRCKVAAAPVAAGALIAQTKAEARAIVGWSFFDRDRLIEARPDREVDINTHYVNALQIARPWRKTIYPAFTVEREDEHAPRHTLDKYAALAGYADAGHFRNPAPAKWIRHTLAQLTATNGRYRQTTRPARETGN
jgi:hypothetical protein